MYPSLIFIIINKEHSIVDSFGFSTVPGENLNGEGHDNGTGHHPATIEHLVFDSPSTKSIQAVDNERSLLPRHSSDPGGPGVGSGMREHISCWERQS